MFGEGYISVFFSFTSHDTDAHCFTVYMMESKMDDLAESESCAIDKGYDHMVLGVVYSMEDTDHILYGHGYG
jgi:hypothetical protein